MSSSQADHRQAIGYLALVRQNANFRNLWFGQIISLLGDWFNLIASAALVTQLTGSGLAVGALFVVRMLAPFLISPLAGVLADRYDRRRLLIFTDLSRAITVLGFLVVRGPGHAWLLYVLTAIQLAISGVFFPARNAILPDIVRGRELGTANALSGATWSVMLALGAALGGLVAGGWGIYPAFVIDSLTFILSAGFISLVSYVQEPALAAGGASVRGAVGQYLDGLRYLVRNADIFAIGGHKAAMGLAVSGGFQVVTVAIAERVFVIGAGGSTSMGLIMAVVGVGTGIGPIVARWVTGDRERRLRAALLMSFLISAFGLALTAPLLSFGLVLLGTFVRGVGNGVSWVLSTQLLLQLVHGKVRGRVFSSEFALFTLATATSAAGAGWLLDHTGLGIGGLLWVMAGMSLIPGILWGAWLRHGSRAQPQPLEDKAGVQAVEMLEEPSLASGGPHVEA